MAYNTTTQVSIGGPSVSAFGDLVTSENNPIVQLDFVYGINNQTGLATTANSATVDTNASRLRLQSGTNSAGSALFQSLKVIRYRAGQGITARFTPLFTTGVASSTQIWGMGLPSGNTVTDGYFFGYNGTAFGILHRISGSADAWTAQASWNGDTCDGNGSSGFNWDKTKGTPVMIRYPFLGYGDVRFYAMNPLTGDWILVHTIRFANSSTTVQMGNPSLYFIGHSLNAGNTSNLTMYCGSVGVFLNGVRVYTGAQFGIDNNKANITTETNIISVRNATTYNGVTNRGVLRLRSVAAGSDGGNGIATMRIKKGVTLGGSPAYTAISGTTADNGVTITSGQSMASYDVAGTTITNGVTIFNYAAARNLTQLTDLTPFDIFILPGETATFSITCTSAATVVVALNWQEDN